MLKTGLKSEFLLFELTYEKMMILTLNTYVLMPFSIFSESVRWSIQIYIQKSQVLSESYNY